MARLNGKDRGVVYKDSAWWARLYINGREKWYRADNKSQAKALYGRLKGEIREGRYFPERFKPKEELTLRAWIRCYLDGCTNRGAANEARYGRRWSLLLGRRTLRDLTIEDFRIIQAKMRGKMKPVREGRPPSRQWSDATINRHFSFVRHVLILAVKDGRLDRNPIGGIKFFPEAHRTRFLANDELGRLKGVMSSEDWQLVVFAIETGLRRSEQFHLRWDQVDLEVGILTLPLPKGGKTRHVPLTAGAASILRSLTSFVESPWVFPGIECKTAPMDSRAFLRRAFEPALRKTGIQGVSWHTLRHTAASRRVMAGVDLVAVRHFLGHRDIETTLRYAHLSPGHLSEAVNRGSLFGTGSKTGSEGQGSEVESRQVIENLVRPEGLEPPTPRSVVWCSIH